MSVAALTLSLVDDRKLEKDPRNLAYLNPSMTAGAYKFRVDGYYRAVCLKRLETVCHMTNRVLVPANCIHHKRKDQSRRVDIFGRAYYVTDPDDLTPLEWAKYQAICAGEDAE